MTKQTKKTEKKLDADLRASAHKIWLAGLGALSLAEEEGEKLFKSLVKKGESFERKSQKRFKEVQDKVEDRVGKAKDKAGSKLSDLGDSFDGKVSSTLKRMGVPTRLEIQRLTKRVEELTIKVDQLKPKARKTTKTRTASRKKTA